MDPTATPPPSRPGWALLVAGLAALGAVSLAVAEPGAVDRASEPSAEPAVTAVSPGGQLAFEEIPAEHRPHYLAAAADPEAFASVPCHCGCEEMLDHGDLRRCFLRPDGGWERHAVGCGICRAEAELVEQLRAQGRSVEDVVAAVDDRYAVITDTDTDA